MNWKDGEYQPKQKRADEKKQLLLDAALELFGTHGFHGTTAKNIAAKAGVATGSFYRYFRDKKAVFMAVCQRMEAELGGRILEFGEQMRQKGHSEQEVLASLIRFSVAAHHHNGDFHREVLAMQIMDPDVAAWTSQREGRVIGKLMEFLRPMAASFTVNDLEAATELVYYSIEEVCHRIMFFDSPVGEERLISALQEMLRRYLFSNADV